MKIRVIDKSYEEVLAMPKCRHRLPGKQALPFRLLLKAVSAGELKQTGFELQRINMDAVSEKEPCLFLMNHSSFLDLKIAATVLFPRQFHIVCTADGFVGKEALMRAVGCIPTRKFVTDLGLVKDLIHVTHRLGSSVLMYPEASYSFDGTETPLPESLGKLLKLLKVPVVMIRTHGAFLRDPLYNGLRVRSVKVRAEMECILTKEEIASRTPAELNELLKKHFTYDHFREQQETHTLVTEPFRAEGLERALYKCPACKTEGNMHGHGTDLSCGSCGKAWTLTEDGRLKAAEGEDHFDHIPDWYRWERTSVRKEIEDRTYRMEMPVDILVLTDMKAAYRVGSGTLTHDTDGFRLEGCDGKLSYSQTASESYSLYSDFFWYEIGDMICIGNNAISYYCFPKTPGAIVAKARLAAEELYRSKKAALRATGRQ